METFLPGSARSVSSEEVVEDAEEEVIEEVIEEATGTRIEERIVETIDKEAEAGETKVKIFYIIIKEYFKLLQFTPESYNYLLLYVLKYLSNILLNVNH